jgi:hypothetical protein
MRATKLLKRKNQMPLALSKHTSQSNKILERKEKMIKQEKQIVEMLEELENANNPIKEALKIFKQRITETNNSQEAGLKTK